MIPFIAIIVVLIALVHVSLRAQAAKTKTFPDTYPLEVLSKEPAGNEVIVTSHDGARIRAVVNGNGPTVVLAHGFMANIVEWNVIANMLVDEGYRVISFDQRGHGKSTIGSEGIGSLQMAGDYKAVLDHFNVQDATLVGHSMGGFLSLVYALTYPEAAREQLSGLIFFASTAGNVNEGSTQNRVQIPLIKSGVIRKVMESDTYGTAFGASLMGKPASPAVIKAMLKVMLEQNTSQLIPILEAMANEDYYARLGEVTVPTVVVCGEADSTTPRWHSERLGKDIRNARNVWVPGKGHLLNWEAPEALVDAVHSLTPANVNTEQMAS
jgi:non-heme chloroperoxidase